MAKEYKLTQERLDALREELHYLKTVREKEVADLIKEARSFGDLSENSEYDEAKNEQGKVFSRKVEVEEILANYVLIDPNDISMGIQLGALVTVLDDEGETTSYKIVGSEEADPMQGRISEESPLGRALLGKNAGEKVSYDAPSGATLHYEITEVTSQ
jgi:transcription elongation factor GreA